MTALTLFSKDSDPEHNGCRLCGGRYPQSMHGDDVTSTKLYGGGNMFVCSILSLNTALSPHDPTATDGSRGSDLT